MNALIKINYDCERPTVLGRELHEFLQVETPYKKWFGRMCEYGFTDGIDYSEVSDKIVQNPQGGRPATDHQLTISMAKLLEVKQKVFVTFLLDRKFLYRDKKGKLMPYTQYVQSGLFVLKECINDKTEWSGTQVLVTPKGRETFRLMCVAPKVS